MRLLRLIIMDVTINNRKIHDSKPRYNHAVHRDKYRNKYLRPGHCMVYTSCKPPKNQARPTIYSTCGEN